MQVRVFEGFQAHGKAQGARETPLAIDTDLELVTCPDGNLQVSDMSIGGASYEPDQPGAACNTGSGKGAVRFDDGQHREITATAGDPAAPPAPSAPRCDPATWRCAAPPPAPSPAPR